MLRPADQIDGSVCDWGAAHARQNNVDNTASHATRAGALYGQRLILSATAGEVQPRPICLIELTKTLRSSVAS